MSLAGENDMTKTTKLSAAARVLMGAMLLFSGLNAFFHFVPMPPEPPAAGAFLGALAAAGYFFPMLKIIEIGVGVLLVSGRFVPLALTIAAPILVNVVAFHAALAPAGLAVPLVLLAAELFLAWTYRAAFAPLLRAKPEAATEVRTGARNELATAS
jgi:putative oxidoreductase